MHAQESAAPVTLVVQFKKVRRITLLACIFSNCGVGRPVFVFEGTHTRTMVRLRSTGLLEESLASFLPVEAFITARLEVAATDYSDFLKLAKCLVTDAVKLRNDGRRMLLPYDGYCSRLSVAVLYPFAKNNLLGTPFLHTPAAPRNCSTFAYLDP